MSALSSVQIAVAGEALIDLIARPDGAFEPCLGGAVYNLCRALSLQGLSTLYLNPFSKDRFGRALCQQMLDDGVLLSHAEPIAEPTSLAVVSLDASGHPDCKCDDGYEGNPILWGIDEWRGSCGTAAVT